MNFIGKIYRGNFLEVAKNFPNECIDLIITDPPFGCNAWRKGEYDDDESFIKGLIPKWLGEMHRLLKPSRHVYVFVPTKYVENWIIPFKKLFNFNNILVCQNMKTAQSYENKFRNNYQMILYGSKGKPRNFNVVNWILTSDSWYNDSRNKNPQRYVYNYPSFIPPYIKATVEERSGSHPDEKNPYLIEKLIEISSNVGELVLDGFCGSGVVPAMAKKLRRNYIGIEINEKYHLESLKRVKNVKASKKIVEFL